MLGRARRPPWRLLPTRLHALSQCRTYGYIQASRSYHATNSNLAATAAVAPSDIQNESFGLFRLLNSDERQLLSEQRQLTEKARKIAALVNSKGEAASQEETPGQVSFMDEFGLESTFSVVVAGEFNAGKSTLINALLGDKLLESGALPTTDCITILTNADSDKSSGKSRTGVQHLPSGVTLHSISGCSLLEDLTLVDTPGTNAVIVDHTARTLRLLPSADLIMFVTSADRPFPDSERSLLRSIQAYRKSIVIVVNKMDILDASGGDHGKNQKQEMVDFVADNASELLGARPIVIPISSRDALAAKLMNKPSKSKTYSMDSDDAHQHSNVWHRSNFASLESFLKDTLTARAKIKSKLTNPIGVVEGIMDQCFENLTGQRKSLAADVSTLAILDTQFDGWKKEVSAELDATRRDMVDMVALEGKRCDLLLRRSKWDERLGWVFGGQNEFERSWHETRTSSALRQSNELEKDLITSAMEAADLIATRSRAQGQAVIEYLGKRPAVRNQSLIGTVTAASRFDDTRRSLADQLSKTARNGIASDEQKELHQIFSSLRQTLVVSGTLHIGAFGSAISTGLEILDPLSGLAAVLSFAASGTAFYSVNTARISRQHNDKWNERVDRLDVALEAICQKELDRVSQKILRGIGPYTRFVETERNRIETHWRECEDTKLAAKSLRSRVNKIV